MRVDLNGVEDLHGNALFDSVVDHAPRTNSFTVKVDYVEPEIAPLRLDSPAGFGYRWLYADLTGPGVRAAVIRPTMVNITASNPEGCVYLSPQQFLVDRTRSSALTRAPRISITITKQPCDFTIEIEAAALRDAFGRGNLQALSYPPAGSMQEPAPPETLGETPADEPVEPPARPTGLHAPTVTHAADARMGRPTGRQHHHLHGPTAASETGPTTATARARESSWRSPPRRTRPSPTWTRAWRPDDAMSTAWWPSTPPATARAPATRTWDAIAGAMVRRH